MPIGDPDVTQQFVAGGCETTIGNTTSYLTVGQSSRVRRVIETVEYGDDGSVIKKTTETEYEDVPSWQPYAKPFQPYTASYPYVGDPLPNQSPTIWYGTHVQPCSAGQTVN